MISAANISVSIEKRFGLLTFRAYYRGVLVTEAMSEAGAINQALHILNRDKYRKIKRGA